MLAFWGSSAKSCQSAQNWVKTELSPLEIGFVQKPFDILQAVIQRGPPFLLGRLGVVLGFDEFVEIADDLGCIDARAQLAGIWFEVQSILENNGLPTVPLGVGIGDVVTNDLDG